MSQPNTNDHHAGIFIALVPWVLFSVVCRISVDAASLLALAASAVIAAPGIKAGRPKILELAAVVSFAGFAAVVLAIDPGAADTLHRYARAIAAGLLALIAFGSLLFTPFTEQYAREALPERVWNTAKFKAGNRAMTAMWGAVFAAMVPCHIIAGSLDTTRSNLIFNWVIPVALVMWAIKRSTVPAEAAATPTHA
jgi:uncharacterized membrane protein